MKILAIETSCDETAMAVLEIKKEKTKKFFVLSSTVSSQAKLHEKYGGVYPFLAKREHQQNLPIVLKKTLKKAGLELKKIDLIALTAGPGLEPCLWTGINFAKDLAQKIKKPIIPVNHIEAHILINFIHTVSQKFFPAICLIVSGGHTQIILMNGIGKYKIIGETRDDAAGECFDKTARIIGLKYPGGPAIAQQAELFKKRKRKNKFNINLPRPMINQKNYDFSFSGLKTAVFYDFKNRSIKTRKSKKYIQEISSEIEQSIIDVLIRKTIKAAKDYKAKTIILAGGVAANNELGKQLKLKIKKNLADVQFLKPETRFCTDNAVMVAVGGYFNRKNKLIDEKKWQKIKANGNLKI